jgi:hypothetical protein
VCDECHKRILCFDLTSESLVAIVVDVRLYQPKDRGNDDSDKTTKWCMGN